MSLPLGRVSTLGVQCRLIGGASLPMSSGAWSPIMIFNLETSK